MEFRIDSESILCSKESILFMILWPKTVILKRFKIIGNQNRFSPSAHGRGRRDGAVSYEPKLVGNTTAKDKWQDLMKWTPRARVRAGQSSRMRGNHRLQLARRTFCGRV